MIAAFTTLVVVTTMLAACSAPAKRSGSASPAGAVTLVGGHLRRDGRPWVPHGLVSVAFVAPPKAAQGVFATAYRQFRPVQMSAARAWGADSIRFQVSQPGLDPKSPLFDPAFRSKVVAGVRAARAAGLSVIVSVQDEQQSGERHPTSLPDDATRRVWASLAPDFNHDPGIMYEMLNEPRPQPSPANWRAWATAMNKTIATIRGTGSRNVVVADGLLLGERLSGAPDLTDPVHAVVYASHPYAHDAEGQTAQAWDDRFGRFARTHPVIVTEWTTVPGYFCDRDTAKSAVAFVRYLRTRQIGLTAYAFDFSGDKFGSVAHGPQHQASTFTGTSCGSADFGPGGVVQSWYRGS
ncbi:cellulase family glycosylhydrolase [Streptomyces sp. SL13]|uniref:cellulase n=1 Tax=Streptantibioticus silvisoli TaxID=2705255 RepID=A0AA90H0H0_9ACTN|nr:cellulase family glycosylhydrolase [Streptantibioticus silvisoli]MDI5971019.1 cellulase family glycosylhydrolase [Streptantibioticus silvisoli]